uniref:Adenosine deaminase n=1 Tax=Trypanosoma congolense (strain IL3000) TaxID=1068625 RepID=G0US15_TRYCI|nr:conserved hypothetical protein [Trypanosoma congolense IL3000]
MDHVLPKGATLAEGSICRNTGETPAEDDGSCGFARAWKQYMANAREVGVGSIPKVDLHCHLNGSISPGLLSHMERIQRGAGLTGDVVADVATAPEDGTVVHCPLNLRGGEGELKQINSPAERMKYCFSIFDNVYKLMKNIAFTRMAVQDLLLYSAADNIVLLEIRTSLREELYTTAAAAACSIEAERVSKRSYVEVVITTVEHVLSGGLVDLNTGELVLRDSVASPERWALYRKVYGPLLSKVSSGASEQAPATETEQWNELLHHLHHRMHVRLLVSINRGGDAAAAHEAVAIAEQLQQEQLHRFLVNERTACKQRQTASESGKLATCITDSQSWDTARRICWITGIDFSGHCSKGSFRSFVSALNRAREACSNGGGSLSHRSLGVTLHAAEKPDAEELAEMVEFAPDRWGHLVFSDPTNLAIIARRHDPIELCITSNFLTGGYDSMEKHHISSIISVHQCQQVGGSRKDGSSECRVEDTAPRYADLLVDDVQLAKSMHCRVRRRLRRWGRGEGGEEIYGTSLANVSFHTDDRGVFETTMAQELQLLLQHPTMRTNDSDLIVHTKVLWALQRLALVHAFELPLELLFYLSCVLREGGEDGDGRDCKVCHCCSCGKCHNIVHVQEMTAQLSSTAYASLSCKELEWLLENFDAHPGQISRGK